MSASTASPRPYSTSAGDTTSPGAAPPSAAAAFFLRHEFAIRRLHSLLGIVPLGLYMVVHLTTNASLLNGSETFQKAVYLIHSPGKLLPLIEWGFIFTPLVFHAGIGIWISKTARLNNDRYKLAGNKRYAWQRYTGILALVYLFFHILHLHGWFHIKPYLSVIQPLGFGSFRPYQRCEFAGGGNAGIRLAGVLSGRHAGLRLSPRQRAVDRRHHLGIVD